MLRQLVRVFIEEGTYGPGFQFLPDGQLHPAVVSLFRHAMELKIPHNYFTSSTSRPRSRYVQGDPLPPDGSTIAYQGKQIASAHKNAPGFWPGAFVVVGAD